MYLIFEPESFLIAPAVAAGGIDVQRHGYVMTVQGGVVVQAVLDGYHIVVVGEGDKGPWRIGIDLELVGVTVDKLRVGILPDEVVARPSVGDGRIHGDDGVEEYLEGRFQLLRVVCGQGRGQVAAGREAHHTDVVGVDAPLQGMSLDGAHGFAQVGQGYPVVAVRHAVFQHNEGDALVGKVGGIVVAFVAVGQGVVAPSGADDHGTSRASAFGKKYPYRGLEYLLVFVAGFSLVGILFGGAVGPQGDVDGRLGLAV